MENSRQRTHREHSAEILIKAKTGARKTQLVYSANLNFNIIKKQLDQLLKTGLLEKHEKTYFTTDKGNRFLYHFDEIIEMEQNV